MPEDRRLWGRLAVLAAAVLALHLWFLGASAPMQPPARPALAWSIRSVAPLLADPFASVAAEAPLTNADPTPDRPSPAVRAYSAGVSHAVPAQQPLPSKPSEAPISRFLVPPSARFHYLVTAFVRGSTTQGRARLDWQNDGARYEAQLELDVPGLRARMQRSGGLVTADGLAPLRFADKSRSEKAAHFVRESGKLSFSSNRPDAALAPGAQDHLSVIVQLGAMLAADAARFPAGTAIALQTVGTREVQTWMFLVEGTEQLDLPGGKLPALKLSREPVGPYDARLELWLAPGADYAPVRLRLTQPNGDWVDQLWSSTDRGG